MLSSRDQAYTELRRRRRAYYQTSAAALTREQAARLAAMLPAPRTRTPQRMDAASTRILTRMQQMGW